MSLAEYNKAREAAQLIRQRTPLRPRVALVLGSGLGAFADSLADARKIPYTQIPHFPVSTAIGHAGRLVVGRSGRIPVVVMQGRAHYYEGYTLQEVAFPIRVLKEFGVRVLVVTNAAGGINRRLKTHGLMLMTDHINLLGANPLRGPNYEGFGPRFPDMTEAYSKKLRAIAQKIARRLRMHMFVGVYAAVPGPSYETPAEIRALARIGADAVGMSTVPEVIVANHMGLKVLGFSSVTNMAAGISKQKIHHEEVLEAGERMAGQLTAFLQALMPALAEEAQ
ncbi:MAG: purine-nucleoside phosphorylase [Candidatus Acidiferrales bacterium]